MLFIVKFYDVVNSCFDFHINKSFKLVAVKINENMQSGRFILFTESAFKV